MQESLCSYLGKSKSFQEWSNKSSVTWTSKERFGNKRNALFAPFKPGTDDENRKSRIAVFWCGCLKTETGKDLTDKMSDPFSQITHICEKDYDTYESNTQ